jgi:hypothetical protein
MLRITTLLYIYEGIVIALISDLLVNYNPNPHLQICTFVY